MLKNPPLPYRTKRGHRKKTARDVLSRLNTAAHARSGITLSDEDVQALTSLVGPCDAMIADRLRYGITEWCPAICYAPLTDPPPPHELLHRCDGTAFKYCRSCWCVKDSALKKDEGHA